MEPECSNLLQMMTEQRRYGKTVYPNSEGEKGEKNEWGEKLDRLSLVADRDDDLKTCK